MLLRTNATYCKSSEQVKEHHSPGKLDALGPCLGVTRSGLAMHCVHDGLCVLPATSWLCMLKWMHWLACQHTWQGNAVWCRINLVAVTPMCHSIFTETLEQT